MCPFHVTCRSIASLCGESFWSLDDILRLLLSLILRLGGFLSSESLDIARSGVVRMQGSTFSDCRSKCRRVYCAILRLVSPYSNARSILPSSATLSTCFLTTAMIAVAKDLFLKSHRARASKEGAKIRQVVHVACQYSFHTSLFNEIDLFTSQHVSNRCLNTCFLYIVTRLECLFDRPFYDTSNNTSRSDFNNDIDIIFFQLLYFRSCHVVQVRANARFFVWKKCLHDLIVY